MKLKSTNKPIIDSYMMDGQDQNYLASDDENTKEQARSNTNIFNKDRNPYVNKLQLIDKDKCLPRSRTMLRPIP